MSEQELAAGQGAGATGEAGKPAAAAAATAASTGGTGAESVVDNWQARFTGLQGKHQQVIEAFKVKEEGYTKTIGELQTTANAKAAEAEELTKQFQELDGKYKGLNATLTERETALEQANSKLERFTLIMGEYPDLAPFEVKGLLPKDKEGEDLRKSLADFRSMLAATGEDQLKRRAAGFTPDGDQSTGGRNQTMTLSDVMSKQMEAQARGDFKEATRLENLLVSMQDAASKKS